MSPSRSPAIDPNAESTTGRASTFRGRTGRVLVVVGWLLLGAFACEVLFLRRIGADVSRFELSYLLAFVGYALVVVVVVRRASAPCPGSWRLWLAGCIALRALTLPVEPCDDAYRYAWEGRIQVNGFNPYAQAPDAPELSHLRTETWSRINHPDYPAIYGPVAELEFLLCAVLHPSAFTTKALHAFWDALTIVLLAGILRRTGRPPYLAVLYALCPLVLTAFAVQGHVDSLMLLFVALCVWALAGGHAKTAGAMLGFAVATKIVAVVLLPWFLLRRRKAFLVAVAVIAACYVPYASAGAGLFSSLTRFGHREFFSFLWAMRVTRFESPDGFELSRDLVVAAVVLVGLLVVTAARKRSFTEYAAPAFGWTLLLIPTVHYWYLAWVLLFAPFAIRVRWVVAAAAMVVYFEAQRAFETGGDWIMPEWAPRMVWTVFLAGLAIDLAFWLRRRLVMSDGSST